jgi:hypothetical protein
VAAKWDNNGQKQRESNKVDYDRETEKETTNERKKKERNRE